MSAQHLVAPRPLAWPRPAATRSVAQKINGEVVVLLGWGPAILLQLAHPLVAAGVADHSSFRASPAERLRRLRQTLDAMLALTFGSEAEAARAAQGINTIHDRVHGQLQESVGVFPTGTPYSAHDPALLRWVHATMLEILPRTYELYVGPLTDVEKDRYCLEASGIEDLLGMPRGTLPRSMAQLRAYFDQMLASGQIVVGPTARALAQALVAPEFPAPLRPLIWLTRLATVGLLPPSIRTAYDLPWKPQHATALRLSAATSRLITPLLPSILRTWPAARA